MTAPNTVRGRVTEQKELDGILAVRAIVTDKHIGEHEDPRIHELHGHEPTVFYEVSPVRGLTRLTIIQFVSYYIECLANWLTKLERKIRELRIQMGNKLP